MECGAHRLFNTIINRDSSICISIAAVAYNANDEQKIRKNVGNDYDLNKNYLVTARNLADTINHKLVFHLVNYSKEQFNADHSGEYVRNCNLPYKGIYTFNKTVFLAKKNTGHIELVYYYKTTMKEKITDIIKQTAAMVRFQ